MIFLDTSAFYAAADKDDKYHLQAKRLFSQLLKKETNIFTHSYILAETTSLLHKKLGHSSAAKFLDYVNYFTIVWINGEIHAKSVKQFKKRSPSTLSFVDCVSFTVMQSRKSKTYFGFDNHFDIGGFVRL